MTKAIKVTKSAFPNLSKALTGFSVSPKLIRSIQTSQNGNKVQVTFMRRDSNNENQSHYSIMTERLSKYSLRRLDHISYNATKTTVMHFRHFVLITATYLGRVGK